MLIFLVLLIIVAHITVRDFADTLDKLVRILLFVVLAPLVILYSFFVPYKPEY